MDNIAAQVEAAMATDRTRGGNAKDTCLRTFEAEFAGEGEKPIVVGRFIYEIMYSTTETDAETVY